MGDRRKIIDYLFSLNARGIKYDLVRMSEALKRLGDPQRSYRCVHVAGTNGKGSTCAYVDSVLRAAGRRTALYTSPHLIDFEERFLVDGRPVQTGRWVEVYEEIERTVRDIPMTFFELTTLIGFELFRRERVEWAVIETGMGGRLDATNCVTPRVGIITSISMDHMEYLGADLTAIAGEKLGIVKQGVPVVMARPAQAEVRELAGRICRERQAHLHTVGMEDAAELMMNGARASFAYKGRRVRLALPGDFQAVNALCAITACEIAGIGDAEIVAAGIEKTVVAARFQVVRHRGKKIVFDVAHNPGAAGRLDEALRQEYPGKKICLVMGIMKDKDIAGILEVMCAKGRFCFFTRPDTPRACLAEQLPKLSHARLDPAGYRVISRVSDAVAEALKRDEEIVCVAGSFYTVGEAMTALGIRPYG